MVSLNDRGINQINAYAREHFGGVVECRLTPGKGRTVHALRSFKTGDIILEESPIHMVQAEPASEAFRKVEELCKQHDFEMDFEPLWYWCALRSLTESQCQGAHHGGWAPLSDECQRRLLLLHHEDESIESYPGKAAELLSTTLAPGTSPSLIDALTQVWVLNSFEHSEEPPGYSTYFYSSFMSHSCYPNAMWHESGDNHVVRARRSIDVGDEVCIAYLS